MWWHIYLPIAQHSVLLPVIIGSGFLVGLLSGLFGVGGGFLLTPLLIMIGIPPTVAAASDSNQIVAAAASGTYAHYRLGNVDFKIGLFLLIGGILGGTGGVQVIKVLRQIGNADFLIKITYVVMLGTVGGYMFLESLQSISAARRDPRGPVEKKPSTYARFIQKLPFQMRFDRSGIVLSPIVPLFLGGFVGLLAAIMGVGGGFIMIPVMVYLLRMPMHVVVGTNLFQEIFTCINITIMQAYSNRTVDFILALLLLIGSTIGAQLGSKVSVRLKRDQLKILLASLILLVMIKMLISISFQPHILLSYYGGD
ncbi:MAG: sulfite exporter TauE/SafE family protein [Deltaproteobacteria bacterium]|nr:sulfite exporter TauE/SafE family protein [Deltaproteobacteria bacterium]MBW1962277.1 sulfite exporter TauE/SafE family protein [Deltaproteobacteria bacterium]MBW2153830.1 sulfite exporter TauE/SafE family protein [Deltaproteobacteria bacterium]